MFPSLKNIKDHWTGHESDQTIVWKGHKGEPAEWTGETIFEIIAPIHPKKFWMFIEGWPVKHNPNMSTRPDNVHPQSWYMASPKQKKEISAEYEQYAKDGIKALAQRDPNIGYERVDFDDREHYGFQFKPLAFHTGYKSQLSAIDGGLKSSDSECESVEDPQDAVCSVCFKYCEHDEERMDPV